MAELTRNPTSDDVVTGTWTGSVGSRYAVVDDYPDTAGTDEITAGTAASGITFGFSAFDVPAGSTNIAVHVDYYDYKNGSPSSSTAARLAVGGSVYTATTHNPANGTRTQRTDSWTQNPATEASWTVDDVNGTSSFNLTGFGWAVGDANPTVTYSSIQLRVTYDPPVVATPPPPVAMAMAPALVAFGLGLGSAFTAVGKPDAIEPAPHAPPPSIVATETPGTGLDPGSARTQVAPAPPPDAANPRPPTVATEPEIWAFILGLGGAQARTAPAPDQAVNANTRGSTTGIWRARGVITWTAPPANQVEPAGPAEDTPRPVILARGDPDEPAHPGSILGAIGKPDAVAPFDRPSLPILASAEPPAPDAGSARAGVPPTAEEQAAPARAATLASAEAPRPDAGSALSTVARPDAVAPFDRPSLPILASAEPPRPEDGATLARSGPVDVAERQLPGRISLASAEAPPSHAGAILAAIGRPDAVTPFDRPSLPVLACQEPPPPDAGSIHRASGGPFVQFDPPAVPARASAEPPPPERGTVLAVAAMPEATPHVAVPRRSHVAFAEPPRPEDGRAESWANPLFVPPETLWTRGILASAEPPPPYPGRAVRDTRPIPQPALPHGAPSVLASAEPPPSYAGRIVAFVGPAPDPPLIPTPPACLAGSEPPRPDAGSVALSTVRFVATTEAATPRRSSLVSAEPPAPHAGSISGTTGAGKRPPEDTATGLQYRIYANAGDGGAIDYDTIVDSTPGLSWESGALAYPAVHKLGVRTYDAESGLEERNVDAVVTVRLDASGADITAIPDAPTSLSVVARSSGSARLDWHYNLTDTARVPTGFHVYQGTAAPPISSISVRQGGLPIDERIGGRCLPGPDLTVQQPIIRGGGGIVIDDTTAVATVAYTRGLVYYATTITGLTGGQSYGFVVRAYNATGEEENAAAASVAADSTAPPAPTLLIARAVSAPSEAIYHPFGAPTRPVVARAEAPPPHPGAVIRDTRRVPHPVLPQRPRIVATEPPRLDPGAVIRDTHPVI